MEPELNPQGIEYVRRAGTSSYLTDQTITVTVGSDTGSTTFQTIDTSRITGYECQIEGKRVVLLGFEPE